MSKLRRRPCQNDRMGHAGGMSRLPKAFTSIQSRWHFVIATAVRPRYNPPLHWTAAAEHSL